MVERTIHNGEPLQRVSLFARRTRMLFASVVTISKTNMVSRITPVRFLPSSLLSRLVEEFALSRYQKVLTVQLHQVYVELTYEVIPAKSMRNL